MRCKRYFGALILLIILIFSINVTLAADTNEIKVCINGNILNFSDVKPCIIKGKTFVPLEEVANGMQAYVTWNEKSSTELIVRNGVCITITIGKKNMDFYTYTIVDGKKQIQTEKIIKLDAPAQIVKGKIMVPFKAIAEALGATVSWDKTTKTINILDTQSKVEFANGAGNITNLGLTYYYYGYIYYCNPSDGYKLYRTNIYENSTQKISDEGTFNINIENNWIYYSNDSNLCKMKTDGSNKQKLCNDNPRDIIVANGWIYYGSMNDNGKMYRIKTDGTDRQLITDDYKENKNSGNFGVAGDFVYYVSTDGNKIYRIKTDGTDKTKLNDNYSVAIIVSDNWIYYGNASDFKIYRIETDGSNNEKVCNDKFNFFNVIKDYIYYSNASNNGKLYRINISSNNRILINNDIPNFINISGGWIYYLSNGKFFRARIDSDEHEIIGSSLNSNKNTNTITNSSNTEVKQVICPSCNGAGRITCSSCKGTGSTGTKTESAPYFGVGEREYYEVPIMCWGCGGSGTTICPSCQGTGVILSN